MPSSTDQRNLSHPGVADRRLTVPLATRDVDGFSSRLALPLLCHPLCQLPADEVRKTIEWSNASVLGFLLQWIDLEAMPRSADARLAEALAPLQTKLDLLVDMVGRFSYRGVDLPAVCDVELSPAAIAWQSRRAARRGEWLRIELYFHPVFREPVTLFAIVTGSADRDWRGCCWIKADLNEMPENVCDRLARLALLTQRQQRAGHRGRNVAESQA